MAERFTSVKKVLVTDNASPRCRETLVAAGLEVVQNDKMTKEELIAAVKVIVHLAFLFLFEEHEMKAYPVPALPLPSSRCSLLARYRDEVSNSKSP